MITLFLPADEEAAIAATSRTEAARRIETRRWKIAAPVIAADWKTRYLNGGPAITGPEARIRRLALTATGIRKEAEAARKAAIARLPAAVRPAIAVEAAKRASTGFPLLPGFPIAGNSERAYPAASTASRPIPGKAGIGRRRLATGFPSSRPPEAEERRRREAADDTPALPGLADFRAGI